MQIHFTAHECNIMRACYLHLLMTWPSPQAPSASAADSSSSLQSRNVNLMLLILSLRSNSRRRTCNKDTAKVKQYRILYSDNLRDHSSKYDTSTFPHPAATDLDCWRKQSSSLFDLTEREFSFLESIQGSKITIWAYRNVFSVLETKREWVGGAPQSERYISFGRSVDGNISATPSLKTWSSSCWYVCVCVICDSGRDACSQWPSVQTTRFFSVYRNRLTLTPWHK